jgi:adenine phosphoribosyltransferase
MRQRQKILLSLTEKGLEMDLAAKIRSIPDFPKQGIVFKDITTLLQDGHALAAAILQMKALFDQEKVQVVVGIESRGFIFASILAYEWGIGFVPVRKPGKLPYKTMQESYSLEYGTDSLEMHIDAITPGQRALIVDDLLATGGTVAATERLVRRAGAEVVGACFVIELDFLNGRKKLGEYRIESLVHVLEE